jgi:catechol 2,3-dioxygenase-like lactoylglutathione lyase family enzyme
MAIQRMDNVLIVVDDLDAVISFFVELGMELEGQGPVDAPVNTLGIRRIMFAVDDIDDVVARLRAHGAELVGDVAQYEDVYRLCYVRGPRGHHRRACRRAPVTAVDQASEAVSMTKRYRTSDVSTRSYASLM